MFNPKRDLPKAFAVSFLFVVVLYIGADVAGRVLGPVGAKFLVIVIPLAIVGTVNGLSLTAPRIYYAQPKDGLFLPGLNRLHRDAPLQATTP